MGYKKISRRIVVRDVAGLKPNPRNARIHSKHQIEQIARSIERFGFTNPIIIDADNKVIAGHGRVLAARRLGIKAVPTIRIAEMSEADKRAYVIADNRLAENAGWDREMLALELHYITELDCEFDLTITGFDTAEIDILLDPANGCADGSVDDDADIDVSKPAVSQPGDLWILGNHRLYCGDALSAGSFERVLDGKRAQAVVTDPPYNVHIDGHASGLGAIRHREFAMASGEMSETEFIAFLTRIFENLVANTTDGSLHYVCMDWRHIHELTTAARAVYSEVKNLCVWVKPNGGMGSLYRSRHELVFVMKNGTTMHVNNVELGRHGRNRSNVWAYGLGAGEGDDTRRTALAMHPTVKPVAMIADAIMDSTKRNALVLDAFGGSGTTVIAAEKTGRRARVIEIDPLYVDVAIRRFEKMTKSTATHAEAGRSFAEVARQRLQGNVEVDDQDGKGGENVER